MRTLSLFLPVVIPSWRFFDVIAPSPRIEVAVFEDEEVRRWEEFRPRPQRLSVRQLLGRLVWNPGWNESLFLMSCAERLMQGEEEEAFAREEIFRRIQRHQGPGQGPLQPIQFRLVFHMRDANAAEEVATHIAYISPIRAANDGEEGAE